MQIEIFNNLFLFLFQVFVFLLSVLVTLQQALSSGYLNSVITTIEKRYEIPSSISGIIASMYEIGNVITVIFVSYLGSRRHIPVWIGMGKNSWLLKFFEYIRYEFDIKLLIGMYSKWYYYILLSRKKVLSGYIDFWRWPLKPINLLSCNYLIYILRVLLHSMFFSMMIDWQILTFSWSLKNLS